MSNSTTDLNTADDQNFDAKQVNEAIATGKLEAPQVNVEEDYEASKKFSVSDVDRSEAGAALADSSAQAQRQGSRSPNSPSDAPTTGDPNEFKKMAQEINPMKERKDA